LRIVESVKNLLFPALLPEAARGADLVGYAGICTDMQGFSHFSREVAEIKDGWLEPVVVANIVRQNWWCKLEDDALL
jgi:hypothetical protein